MLAQRSTELKCGGQRIAGSAHVGKGGTELRRCPCGRQIVAFGGFKVEFERRDGSNIGGGTNRRNKQVFFNEGDLCGRQVRFCNGVAFCAENAGRY